jgi:hypothetical protein
MKNGVVLPRALTSLILPLALSLLVVTARHATSPFAFEVTFKASTAGTVQLFYDPTGAGHVSEGDSARFQLNQVDTAITHRFPLPEGTYNWFRFDPIDRQEQSPSPGREMRCRSSAARLSLSGWSATIPTCAPRRSRSMATCLPMPLDPPVMSTLRRVHRDPVVTW